MNLNCILLALSIFPAGMPGQETPVRLNDYAACGPKSLYLVARIRHVATEWKRLQELVGPPAADGSHSFSDVQRAAQSLGLRCLGAQASRDALSRLPMPAIIQVRESPTSTESAHLVVLLRANADGVMVADAPYPVVFLSNDVFQRVWSGYVLLFPDSEVDLWKLRCWALADGALHPGAAGWLVLAGLAGLALLLFTGTPLQRYAAWAAHEAARARALLRPGRPRRAVICGCLAIVALGTGILGLGFISPAPARCAIRIPDMELGEFAPGTAMVTVPVGNSGGTPLYVRSVRSNCSCASVKTPAKVAPQTTENITVELNVVPGPRSTMLSIDSNDPDGVKTVVLHWRGTAAPRLVPGILTGVAPVDRPYHRVVRVVFPAGNGGACPRLGQWKSSSNRVNLRRGRTDLSAMDLASDGVISNAVGELELELSIEPPPVPGLFRATCHIPVDYGKMNAKLTLYIVVDFAGGALRGEEHRIVLSASHRAELIGQQRTVHIAGVKSEADVKLESVPTWLECKLVSTAGGVCLLMRILREPAQNFAEGPVRVVEKPAPHRRTLIFVDAFAAQP